MGLPPLPRDPNDPYPSAQPQAWSGSTPLPPPQPQPQVVYVQAPLPPPVPGRRGMFLVSHGIHWTLTFFTCGLWGVVYLSWWATVRSWQAWRNWRNRKYHHKMYR